MMEREKNDLENLLDAMDKFKEGDETAFDGMTIRLDGEPGECLDEDE